MRQERDLTKGAIVKSLWLFALPLMLGNVLQQLYNLVDTWVVGRYLGKRALAAVGASYTLMTFLTSVVCVWGQVPFLRWHTAGEKRRLSEMGFLCPLRQLAVFR